MKQEPQIILCPYCGHVQTVAEGATVPDQCDECRGLFEPLSRQATQISMGPWYIRDKKNPFRPGCSYEVISKMARNNRIRPTTVMRGPTTRQFWSVARNVPGIAHLLGYCHKCSAKVAPTDAQCHACSAKFEEPKERNELGLAFRTAQEASAAQRALDKEIAAITGAPSPGGSGINPAITAAPGAGLLDEVLGGGKFGGSPLLNFGSAPPSTAAPTAAPAPAPSIRPSAAPTATATAPAPGGEHNFAAGFASPPAPAPSFAGPATAKPLAGRAVDAFSLAGEADDTGVDDVQRKQRTASAMTWALIGFNALLIVVVIALFIFNSKGKSNTNGGDGAKDATPASKSNGTGDGENVANNNKPTPKPKQPVTVATNTNTTNHGNGGEEEPVVEKPAPKKPIDPRLDRNVMQGKLDEARQMIDGGDLAGALPIMVSVRDTYPKAWQPEDLDQRITEITTELDRRAGEANDRKMIAEVDALLASAKVLQNKNDVEGTLKLLAQVRDNYPPKLHPKDLTQRIQELLKQLDSKGKAKFFGQPTD